MSHNLRFYNTTVLAKPFCRERLGKYGDLVRPSTICTDNPMFEGICYGDYGGPLVQKNGTNNIVVGLATYSKGCGRGFPDVYTSVLSHLGFIREQMMMKSKYG